MGSMDDKAGHGCAEWEDMLLMHQMLLNVADCTRLRTCLRTSDISTRCVYMPSCMEVFEKNERSLFNHLASRHSREGMDGNVFACRGGTRCPSKSPGIHETVPWH